mmetsp:Transcript_92935/g.216012  ORF Transcript_92935/g.216012 Transcript_92935/m.216012 type:complete len:123 (+) Transcript_92935:679-1047(+)
MPLKTKSREADNREAQEIATPKKKAKLAWPVNPPLCAMTTTLAQRTPANMHTHSCQEMSDFLEIAIDVSAVESGEHPRMIMVKDKGTKDNDKLLNPMFNEKESANASTRRPSFLKIARRFGL